MASWGVDVRYSYDFGWLSVRDPATGEWHEVWAKDAPSDWRRRAFAEKQARARGVKPSNSADVSRAPKNERPREEAYAF